MRYKHVRRSIITLFILAGSCWCSFGQAPDTVAGIPVNYDEAQTGTYILPDPLQLRNGKKVTNTEEWSQERRPEILEMFKEYQYGHVPENNVKPVFDVFDSGTLAYDSTVVRKQVRIYFSENSDEHYMDALIYLPRSIQGPVPLMLMINFTANSTMAQDPGVRRGTIWNREQEKVPAPKESRFGSFDIQPFIDQGVGIAMVYYGDIQPDFAGSTHHGVQGLFKEVEEETRPPGEWGTIAAWAWGLSRVMDYLETDDSIAADRVALFGISRLGKTVLWAGAADERFAMVIASCSGEGGAALSSRIYGETIAHLTAPSRYPYQFCPNYQKRAKNPTQFPLDAHLLLALMAPRPILLLTGDEDGWSDPKGEFLAAVAAEPVYKLFGKKGLDTDQMPPAEKALTDHAIGYHMHDGGHGTRPSDYPVILSFIQKHL